MKRITRKKAITTFCRECMGCDEHRGGKVGTPWKKAGMMAGECEDRGCPLWVFRVGKEEGLPVPVKISGKRSFAVRKRVGMVKTA